MNWIILVVTCQIITYSKQSHYITNMAYVQYFGLKQLPVCLWWPIFWCNCPLLLASWNTLCLLQALVNLKVVTFSLWEKIYNLHAKVSCIALRSNIVLVSEMYEQIGYTSTYIVWFFFLSLNNSCNL